MRIYKYISSLLLAALMGGSSFPALAQPLPMPVHCAPADKVETEWKARHKEAVVWSGVTDNAGSVVEIWADKAGKKWTLFLRRPGLLCIVASGSDGYETGEPGQDV